MSDRQSGPPDDLVRALVEGPAAVSGIEWHDEIDSTNRAAAEAAARGVAEIHVVGAERQSAGRGRLGRSWLAPPRTSLTFSLVLRPPVRPESLPLLPLLTGLVLAELGSRYCPDAEVGLKWPNDLLIGGRKAAGTLVEAGPAGTVIVGIGLNTDWRGVDRPLELAQAVSLAEVSDRPVDRWRVLAALLGVFGVRYDAWKDLPAAFLDGYRRRCLTLGQQVRIERIGAEDLRGQAVAVDATGALEIRDEAGRLTRVSAGDVWHLRPATP
jgi:BirA family biotin operon repressor/biotin-[acetyl-CoA-carboxylase] ligase